MVSQCYITRPQKKDCSSKRERVEIRSGQLVAGLSSNGSYFNELKSFEEQSIIEERGLRGTGVLS